MSEAAREWLGRRVRVWPAFDPKGMTMPLAEGVVVGYAAAPTILVRSADGSQSDWQVTLPIDVLEERAEVPPARDLVMELGALHRPFAMPGLVRLLLGGGVAAAVCRECSGPDEWDGEDGPYLHPDVHLVAWPCATARILGVEG